MTRYWAKISGPILDRIDLVLEVPAVSLDDLLAGAPGEASDVVRERVRRAREIGSERGLWGGLNATLTSRDLARFAPLDAGSRALLRRAADTFRITGRGVTRIRRVARTIADLAASRELRAEHLAEAIQYRMPAGPR